MAAFGAPVDVVAVGGTAAVSFSVAAVVYVTVC